MKATYLLAVAFLEIIRFSSNGGILNGGTSLASSRSAFSCVFEYLKTPNLVPAVFQCLMATVHRAFETAVSWLVWLCSFIKLLKIYFLFSFFIGSFHVDAIHHPGDVIESSCCIERVYEIKVLNIFDITKISVTWGCQY